MAFPAVESTATTGRTAAAETTSPVTYPAVVSPNALIVCIARVAVAGAIGWPADWTELVESTNDASDDVTAIAYKTAVGDEDGTTFSVTHGSGKSAYIVYSITGAADPVTQAPQISAVAIGTSATPNPASLTPTSGAKDYLWLWLGGWEGEQTSPPAGNPTNYTNPLGANTGTGGAITTNCRVASAQRNLNAASEDPPSWTISVSDDWSAWTMAVHPPPAGAQYTENPRARVSGVSRLALQQALTLAPKAASQSKAQARLTLSYILDRRAPALAEAEPLLQTTFILNPRTRGAARALTQILIPIILTPSARATARARPTLQELLTLSPRARAQAKALPVLQQLLTLTAVTRAAAEAEASLQEVLTLTTRVRATATALTQILVPIILSPRAVATALAATALQQVLALTPRARGQGTTLPALQQLLTLTAATRATAQAKGIATISYTILVQALVRAVSRPSLQEILSLNPKSRAAAEAEAALQQVLALSPRVRGQAQVLPTLQQILTLSPRAVSASPGRVRRIEAWRFRNWLGSANNKTSGTTISRSPIFSVAAGRIVIVLCVTDNPDTTDGETTHHSVSDSKGNTYTKVREHQRGSGAAGAGVTVSIWASRLTTGLADTDTVTLTLDIAVVAKAIDLLEFSLLGGNTFSVAGHNGAIGSSITPSVTLSGLPSAEYLWLGHVGIEGPNEDGWSQDPDYVSTTSSGSTGGLADSNVAIRMGSRDFIGIGDTYNPTLGISRDWSAILGVLLETAPPPIVLTPVGLVLARAIPSITTMGDILSARIPGLQQDIADLQAEIASLKAQEGAEWKI